MNIETIRFIVDRRCKSENKHGVLLGTVPLSSKDPAEDVQLLIKGVAQCEDCTFHSRFYFDQYSDELKLNSIIKVKQSKDTILLKWAILILTAVMSILAPYNLFNFGLTHAISALSISMLFFFICSTIDTWKSNSLSNLQKTIIVINLLLFFYAILMLPTKDAIDILNNSVVKQTLLDNMMANIISALNGTKTVG